MSNSKRSQRKYVKKTYRVRNWHEYEAGLRERGSLAVWISLTDGELANWDAPRLKKKKPGRQRKYSNHAIETAVTLGMPCSEMSRIISSDRFCFFESYSSFPGRIQMSLGFAPDS